MNNNEVEIYNDHLNIFNYYSRGKTCEDNLSRILARLLLENQYDKFHKRVLNLIGVKGNIDYVFSHTSVQVIKRYLNNNNINIIECIPVTLTAKEKDIDLTSKQNNRTIPDIALIVDNKLIFIEAKLGTTIPEKQVIKQVNEYLEPDSYKGSITKIYWEEIIKILSELYYQDFIIKDYLQLIDSNYSNWFEHKFKDLYRIMKKDNNNNIIYKEEKDIYDKNNLINIKISRLLEKYCKDNNIPLHPKFNKRRAFPLTNSFTTEMQVLFNQNQNRLESHIWTGELVTYTKEFNLYYKNNKHIIQSFINMNNKYKAQCSMIPYVLFRDHFGHLKEINMNSITNKIIPEEICNLLCGRKKYNEYKKIINDNINKIEKYIPKFKKYFDEIIEKYYSKSKRTNLTISIGYDIIISYPQEIYFKLDENDKLHLIVEDSIKIFEKYFSTKINTTKK